MEGEALLRALRAEPALRRTRIIMLTAERYSRLPEPLRAAGAQGYLMKPIDRPQFFAAMDTHLPDGA